MAGSQAALRVPKHDQHSCPWHSAFLSGWALVLFLIYRASGIFHKEFYSWFLPHGEFLLLHCNFSCHNVVNIGQMLVGWKAIRS